jgi:hypothetical protein
MKLMINYRNLYFKENVYIVLAYFIAHFGFYNYSFSQLLPQVERLSNEYVDYEIKIHGSLNYSHIIQFSREGLLITNIKNKKNKTKFIPHKKVLKSLNKGIEIIDLFFYIKDEKIMELTDLEEPNFSYKTHKGYMIIQITDLVENRCLYLKYGCYDYRIDKLIDMLIEIIPKKYRKQFKDIKWILNENQ